MKKTYTPVLNVRISPLTYAKALQYIKSWMSEGKKTYICVAAVHLVMECQKDKVLLDGVNKAGLVTPDGMPLVWLSKLYGQARVERVYGPTLMLKVCSMAQRKGYKVFLLGGAKGQSKELAQKLTNKFPRLSIVGNRDTPKRPIPTDENNKIIKEINGSGAQVLFVGLGCPYQEHWMIENRDRLNANVLMGVGAAFDFISGRFKQAPVWMQRMGFEWLFRLLQDPKKLWYRYTLLNAQFLYRVSGEIAVNFTKGRGFNNDKS